MAVPQRDRWRGLHKARRRTWAEFKEKDNTMTKVTEADRSFVLETLGEASIGMWVDTPHGEFDSTKATEFADRIVERMEQIAQR